MPDFDVDFCQDRRGEVIEYTKDKYGSDRVAQIITFGTLQAKAVLRDVGRVMQLPFGQVDRLSKLVPFNPANPPTLQEAIDAEPRLRQAMRDEDEVRELVNTALELEGLFRNASTHAAGVVIGDRPSRRTRAALPGSKIRSPRHAIQHEVGGTQRVGQIRLPGSENPDGDPAGAPVCRKGRQITH